MLLINNEQVKYNVNYYKMILPNIACLNSELEPLYLAFLFNGVQGSWFMV